LKTVNEVKANHMYIFYKAIGTMKRCQIVVVPPPFPSPTVTYVLELPVRHKLDDVSNGRLSDLRAQASIVPVQELHGTEVGPPDANDDDGHGQAGGVDDGAARLIHVCDHSVSDDQQNKVLLRGDGSNRYKSKQKHRNYWLR